VSDDTSAGDSGLTQCVDIRGGTTLELGANFKRDESSTQTGGGRLRVTWYAKPHCTGASKTPVQWADTTDAASWQKLRVSDLAVPPEVHSANVEIIQAIDGRGHFTAYWDDVYLTVSE
jgi:hypothetical protein